MIKIGLTILMVQVLYFPLDYEETVTTSPLSLATSDSSAPEANDSLIITSTRPSTYPESLTETIDNRTSVEPELEMTQVQVQTVRASTTRKQILTISEPVNKPLRTIKASPFISQAKEAKVLLKPMTSSTVDLNTLATTAAPDDIVPSAAKVANTETSSAKPSKIMITTSVASTVVSASTSSTTVSSKIATSSTVSTTSVSPESNPSTLSTAEPRGGQTPLTRPMTTANDSPSRASSIMKSYILSSSSSSSSFKSKPTSKLTTQSTMKTTNQVPSKVVTKSLSDRSLVVKRHKLNHTYNDLEEVETSEFPFYLTLRLSLTDSRIHIRNCSGAILNIKWAITSASCFFSSNKQVDTHSITAVAGSLEIFHSSAQIISLQKVFIHPQFSPSFGELYDVALVLFSEPLKLSSLIQPINFASAGEEETLLHSIDQNVTSVSAGLVDSSTARGEAIVLYVHSLPKRSSIECEQKVAATKILHPFDASLLSCSIAENSFSPVMCSGHYGGLFFQHKPNQSNVKVLVGIVSWNTNCALPHHNNQQLTLYTRMSPLIPWIIKTIKTTTPGLISPDLELTTRKFEPS